MQKLRLHIVSFDIPYPPDYGGAIDVFYKVKNLSEAGVAIQLHCSEYGGRARAAVLDELCEKVHYYPRKTGWRGISPNLPYMVYSRRSADLLENLQQTVAPILFDGAGASYYLGHPSLQHHHQILRPQNIEHDYYRQLARREKSIAKRIYYVAEAALLKVYEKRLRSARAFFTVALHDHAFFKKAYPHAVHEYIPSFQPYNDVNSKTGKGDFALYHGNLALAENEQAALFLLKEVIPHTDIRFVIAGRNPGSEIIRAAAALSRCTLIANPSMEIMDNLISDAQVHVLPTFQDTGLKLKLLHALFHGRHVLVNEPMVYGTGLSETCSIAADPAGFIAGIEQLRNKDFGQVEIHARRKILMAHYDNKKNAERILTYLQQISP